MEIQLPRPISRIVFRGCPEHTQTELLSRMQIQEGAMLSNEVLERVRETARVYNERLAVLVRVSIREEEFLKSAPEMRKTFLAPATNDGVTVIIFDPATPPQRIRVEGSQLQSMLIERTTPERGTEVVKLAVVIGKDGSVIDTDPLAGPESLIASAVDAVKRWKYKPTLLNGRAVEIETTVDVGFSLKA